MTDTQTTDTQTTGTHITGIRRSNPSRRALIGWTGAGVVIAPGQSSVPRLRAGVEQVLRDSGYRAAASRLRDAIARSGGVGRAADIVEQWLGETLN